MKITDIVLFFIEYVEGEGDVFRKWIKNTQQLRDLPGGPAAKTPCSQCREPGFHP